MIRSRILGLAAAGGVVALGAYALLLVALPAPRRVEAAPPAMAMRQTNPSPCVVTATKRVSPPVVRLGEDVTVTLYTSIACPEPAPPLRLVLTLDASGSMAGMLSQQMKQAATRLVRDLDLPSHPDWSVGVVEYNTVARTLCRLTNAQDQAIACINRVGAAGGTRVDAGLMEALRVLRGGRPGIAPAREAIVLVTDGGNNDGCAPILQVARQIRGQGVLLVAVCLGPDCDAVCMRQTATTPSVFFEVPNPSDIGAAFDAIGSILVDPAGFLVVVVEEPGAEMTPLPGTMRPDGTLVAGGSVTWQEPWPSTQGLTMTLRLRPGRVGYWPADRQATGTLLDFEQRVRTWTYPVPWVMVLDPSVPPTVTVTVPPTPVPTSTFTPSPTLPPTATPSYPVPLVVCDGIRAKVPPAAVNAALAGPATVAGYGRLCRPELPPGPSNTLRGSLSIQSVAKPYHPLYNGLVWKCGCP